jgi:uncharacterized protein (DUF488 family)
VKIYTIGFTKKPASAFFGLLKDSRAERLVDVRLNNVSQLAGFAKRDDLKYFLAELCGMGYVHDLELAPSQTILDAYKKHKASWGDYERWFIDLISERKIETSVPRELIANSVLLCSEANPHHCHRRLVAEYLADRWGDVTIEHLM